MNSDAYIYALSDPLTCQIRYIGGTCDPARRWREHCLDALGGYHTAKDWWVTTVMLRGKKPRLSILARVGDRQWRRAENRWIAICRAAGFPLTNRTDLPVDNTVRTPAMSDIVIATRAPLIPLLNEFPITRFMPRRVLRRPGVRNVVLTDKAATSPAP